MPPLSATACLDPGQDKRQQLSSQVTAGLELKGLHVKGAAGCSFAAVYFLLIANSFNEGRVA